MKLDATVIEQVRNPIRKAWNYIAADVYELCGDNEEALEMCIDANRLSMCVDEPEAEKLVLALVKEHGYSKTLKFLGKNIQLL
jgi:hypothetical protein